MAAIECVRYRGSNLGAGFAAFTAQQGLKPPLRVKVFVEDDDSLQDVRKKFSDYAALGLRVLGEETPDFRVSDGMSVYTAYVEASEQALERLVNTVNAEMWKDGRIRGRVYSSGRYLDVYKDVGYPSDVAKKCGLVEDRVFADAWIAHTRQPTNSPGMLPIWSHPFASFEFAIVHNGDISSFGSNTQLLSSLGMTSHVGTDSEVITRLLDHLVRVKGLTLEEAASLLVNSQRRALGGSKDAFIDLGIRLRGAQLDGPFSVVAGYCDGYDVYLLGLVDRSKFRPLVVGEDDTRFYVASEECQIRLLSPQAKVWTPEPGGFVLASVKRGVIEAGRVDRELFRDYLSREVSTGQQSSESLEQGKTLDAHGLDYRQLNELILREMEKGEREVRVANVNGQRYIGVNLQKPSFFGSRLVIHGFPGNCLANLNSGLEFVVHGNAADDVADTMHAGRVVIHGDARDVVGQALQGGEVFVRGSVGNRAAIQMREYRVRRPFLVVGGRADDYLGEYMAGGIVVVLGLDSRNTGEGSLVGRFTGTGMVGGKMFVRSRIRKDAIGLPPTMADVTNYLHSLVLDGLLSKDKYSLLTERSFIDLAVLKESLDPVSFEKVKRFYVGKYAKPLEADHRELDTDECNLLEPKLREYFSCFGLDDTLFEKVLSSRFTVISPPVKESFDNSSREEARPENLLTNIAGHGTS